MKEELKSFREDLMQVLKKHPDCRITWHRDGRMKLIHGNEEVTYDNNYLQYQDTINDTATYIFQHKINNRED